MSPKISILTPSIRMIGTAFLQKSIHAQTFKDFEWVIATNKDILKLMCEAYSKDARIYLEPDKRNGDFFSVYKAHNFLAQMAEGELTVIVVDYTFLPPTTLEKLWENYQRDKKSVITVFGDFYATVKPDLTFDEGSYVWSNKSDMVEIEPIAFDFAVASIPRCAYFKVGGLEEEYDKWCGNAEKDFVARLRKVGYKILNDPTLSMKGYRHGPPKDYNPLMNVQSTRLLQRHLKEVEEGKRLKLRYL